jgi:hypothetical protein
MSHNKLQQDTRDRILRKVSELIDKNHITSDELKEFRSRYISHSDRMLSHRAKQIAEVKHAENLQKARDAKAAKAKGVHNV